MRYHTNSLGLLPILFSVLFIATPNNADIEAFTGTMCDGAEGADVPCDGSCHSFTTRHSFQVIATDLHCVTAFLNANCDDLVGVFQTQGSGSCVHVNTGTSVMSFRCSANDTCVA